MVLPISDLNYGEFRPNDKISIGSRIITRKGSRRIAIEAFKIARTRKQKLIAAVQSVSHYLLSI